MFLCGMAARNAGISEERSRMRFRIGVHLGDVITEGDDIYGEGVNIAARLEALAESGGICISRQAYDQVEGKLGLDLQLLGAQNLKNIAKPIDAYAISCAGITETPRRQTARLNQEIRYCRASDGVRLAYAIAGQGPRLVLTANSP
jgi:class 3 adenylate cyclase